MPEPSDADIHRDSRADPPRTAASRHAARAAPARGATRHDGRRRVGRAAPSRRRAAGGSPSSCRRARCASTPTKTCARSTSCARRSNRRRRASSASAPLPRSGWSCGGSPSRSTSSFPARVQLGRSGVPLHGAPLSRAVPPVDRRARAQPAAAAVDRGAPRADPELAVRPDRETHALAAEFHARLAEALGSKEVERADAAMRAHVRYGLTEVMNEIALAARARPARKPGLVMRFECRLKIHGLAIVDDDWRRRATADPCHRQSSIRANLQSPIFVLSVAIVSARGGRSI